MHLWCRFFVNKGDSIGYNNCPLSAGKLSIAFMILSRHLLATTQRKAATSEPWSKESRLHVKQAVPSHLLAAAQRLTFRTVYPVKTIHEDLLLSLTLSFWKKSWESIIETGARMKSSEVHSTALACLLLGFVCIGCNAFSATDSHGRTELCDVSES